MRISIDTDADDFISAIRAVHAAYGVPYDAGTLPVDDDTDDEDEYTRDDLEAMSLAGLRALAKEAGYSDDDIHGLNKSGLVNYLLGGETEGDEDFFPGKWNRKRIRQLAEWVHGGDAEIALRFIAENAPAVGLDETLAHMGEELGIEGFNGQNMGGRMSSVGFAQNSISAKVGNIYDTDYKHRKYRMDKGIAKVLLEELDTLGS